MWIGCRYPVLCLFLRSQKGAVSVLLTSLNTTVGDLWWCNLCYKLIGKKCTTVKVSGQNDAKSELRCTWRILWQQICTHDLNLLQIWNTKLLIATFKTVCGRGTFGSYVSALHIQTSFLPFYAVICIKARLTGILFLIVLNTCKSLISKLWTFNFKKCHTLCWYLS